MVLPGDEWTRARNASFDETHADLETLCQSCGLCCDGSLFTLVDLRPDEVEPARRRRLRVLENGKAFEQRCTALTTRDGAPERRACGIYNLRPLSCRRFVCRLYARYRCEGGTVEPRIEAVRRVRQLVARLEATGLTPDDFENERHRFSPRSAAGQLAIDDYRELVRRLQEDFARA